jgi:hypothetical protein
MTDEGQGGEVVGKDAAKLPVYRKGENLSFRGGKTPGGKKEDPIEDEGLGKSGYGCLL